MEVDVKDLLEIISPYPQANITRERPNQKIMQFCNNYRHTGKRKYLVSRRKMRPAKIPKRTVSSSSKNTLSRCKRVLAKCRRRLVSSSSESDMLIKLPSDGFSEDESIVSGMSEKKNNFTDVTAKDKLKIGDFATIEVFSSKGKTT